MTESGSGRRDWALWFQPRALAGRVEGLIFAGLCILSLAFTLELPLTEARAAVSA